MGDTESRLFTSDESGGGDPGEPLRRLVRERPLVAMTVAGGCGALVGGLLLSRLGRLAVIAAVGYVAHELWHREGRLAIDDVVGKLSSSWSNK